MNLAQLTAQFRARVDDTVATYLWPDTEVTGFANQAEREAAERAKLLLEDANTASTTITITQTGGLATATAVAHPFRDQQRIRISGAAQAAYNVDAVIKVTGANTFTFAVASAAPSPATGTITAASLAGMLCNIAGLAGTATYPLDPKVFEIKSVTWDGRFLDGIAADQLDRIYRDGWKTLTGRPTNFIDPQEKCLTLFRQPVDAAPIRVIAYRYPFVDLAGATDGPEIAEPHHFGLLDWMEYLAFIKDDTETQDLPRAERAAARFTASFGQKISANARRKQRERWGNQVQMNPNW